MDTEKVIQYLQSYDGPEVKIMEVCGTHTSSIFKNGIRSHPLLKFNFND